MAQNDGKQSKNPSPVWIFQTWILLEPSKLKTFSSRVIATNKTLRERSGSSCFPKVVLKVEICISEVSAIS